MTLQEFIDVKCQVCEKPNDCIYLRRGIDCWKVHEIKEVWNASREETAGRALKIFNGFLNRLKEAGMVTDTNQWAAAFGKEMEDE